LGIESTIDCVATPMLDGASHSGNGLAGANVFSEQGG
jgi:hypothetical protein